MAEQDIEYALLLKSHSPERAKELLSQRYSIFGDQKPILVLHDSIEAKARRQRLQQPRTKKKRKSAANQALEDLRQSINPQYDAYTSLTKLWQSYIEDILFQAKGDHLQQAQALLSADWHGATLEVVASQCPSYVGLDGILLWEARSMMLLVTPQNRVRRVPKRGCVFRFTTLPFNVELIGSRLICRSSERTTRKFKPRDVTDIVNFIGF